VWSFIAARWRRPLDGNVLGLYWFRDKLGALAQADLNASSEKVNDRNSRAFLTKDFSRWRETKLP
jgi:hypothetical protein